MLRKKRTRPPLAEMSMFSAMLAPLKSIVSKPAWPSSVSLSSPGFQTKVSSPAPMQRRVVAVAAVDQVVALAADEHVVAEAAVDRELDAVGLAATLALIDVVAAQAVERQAVVGLLLEEDVDRGVQPEDVDAAGVARGAERRRRRWCR